MKFTSKNFIRPCYPAFSPDESCVQSDLSYTPADMLKASKDGRAVSPANLSEQFFSPTDNTAYNDFSVNPEYQRGVDINDLWERSQASKKKIRKAYSDGSFKPVTNQKGV